MARVADAERAVKEAMANARQATTLKDACSAFGALAPKIDALQHVTPPAGFERPFSEARNGLSTLLDVMQDQRCSDNSGADADTIRGELDSLHKDFVRLQQIGAKP